MIKAAVMGKPIEHSLSPLVHSLIYQALDLKCDYGKLEMGESEAREFLLRELGEGWSGFSLTMPLKEVGFDIGVTVEDNAMRARAINTITPSAGFNTDISGLARVLRDEKVEFSHVTLVGSGATARSSLIALESLGFEGKVDLVRRSATRDALLPRLRGIEIDLMDVEYWRLTENKDGHLLISSIPAVAQSSISMRLAGFEGTLLDFTYRPWPSVLAGVTTGRVISGLKVLVSQAVDQASIFTNLAFDRDGMYHRILSSTARQLAAQ